MLVDKYQSVTCQNAIDCAIIPESNACVWTCGIPVNINMANALMGNLDDEASRDCSKCPAPPSVLCEWMVPGCVNGKCVAVDPI
jgi:hypothetical protein